MRPSSFIRRLAGEPRTADDGLAKATVRGALLAALLAGLVLWNLLAAVVALSDRATLEHPGATAALHLGLAALALAAATGRLPCAVLAGCTWLAYLWIWNAVDDVNAPTFFAAVWLSTLTAALCGFMFSGAWGTVGPAAAMAGTAAAMAWTQPDRVWTVVPLSFFVTSLATFTVARIGISYLWEFTREADRATAAAQHESRSLAQAQSMSRASAESARVLHDTVINTLAAIANGGGAVRDRAAVRDRCARDADTVTILLHGSVPGHLAWESLIPTGTAQQPVVHTGIAATDVDTALAHLPRPTADAVRLATAEAVRNAIKHSGASQVTVDVQSREGSLCVTVRDDGHGFDGKPVPGRGVAESILSRSRAFGIDVDLDTALEAGTTVSLSARTADGGTSTLDFRAIAADVRRRAGLLWSVGLTVVTLVITAVNHPGDLNPAYAMVAMGAVACTVVWRVCGTTRRMPRWCAAMVLAFVVASYVAAAAGVDFARADPIKWQALGPAGPLILLLAYTRYRTFFVGLFAVAALSIGLTLHTLPTATPAGTVALAGTISIGFPLGWFAFQAALIRIGRRAAADQARAHADNVRAATTRAAQVALGRWRAAGLHASVELLEAIAEGRAHAESPTIQRRAADEESYLRALTRLDPELVHAGYWIARAVAAARERWVLFSVRTGGADLSEQTAEAFGGLLLKAIAAVPTGQQLTVTVLPTSAGVRACVVAPTPCLANLVDQVTMSTWLPECQHHMLGDEEMVEFVVAPVRKEVQLT